MRAPDMPGKHWTKREVKAVRQQLANGVPAHEILLEQRSWAGMRYLLRTRHMHWSNRWTPSQTRSLVAQIKQGKKLPNLHIATKSSAAINAKRSNLRRAGKLGKQPGATKRQYAQYAATELRILEHYGWDLGWSARKIHAFGVLPGRTYHSISKKMGRLSYWDPLRVERAKQGRRLTEEESH